MRALLRAAEAAEYKDKYKTAWAGAHAVFVNGENMRYDFRNKIVALTGASSGIGRELATHLVTCFNCRVYGIARRENILNEMRTSLGELFIPCPFDVAVKENWTEFSKSLENDGVRVDILINCAGILPEFSSTLTAGSDAAEKALSINFLSQVYAAEAMLPIIKKSTQGALISFASSSALCPFAGVGAYCASKSASQRYFECLAAENSDIYVATVLNGFVKTDIMKNQHASERDIKIFSAVCADLDKTVNKLMRRFKRRKKRIIVGFDAHVMNLLYKLFPNAGPKIITKILKKSGLEIFSKI